MSASVTHLDGRYADGPFDAAWLEDLESEAYAASVARMLSDDALAAVVEDWTGRDGDDDGDDGDGDGDGDDDGGASLPDLEEMSNRELLAHAAALPAIARAGVLSLMDVSGLDGWEAEELVRLNATVGAAVTAAQVTGRLALAATYGRLRAEAVARRDARDAAARAEGERVPPRRPIRDQSVSALMKMENISRAAAEGRLAQARDYVSRLPRMFARLERGEISPDHLRMVRTETTTLSAAASRQVEELIADRLDLTPGEVAHAARVAAADVDAEAFTKRRALARHQRTAYVRPLPDGMAMLSIIGPAEQIALAWMAIDEQARALRKAGDLRSLSQLRCDLFLGAPPPPGCDLDHTGDTIVNTDTGEVITRPWQPDVGRAPPEPPSGPTPDRPSDQRPADPSHSRRTFQGRPVATVLVLDLSTFLGADDLPALIQGVGPVPAHIARELAHGSEQWFRAALDSSGVCRDYGRLRAPRQDLRDLIIRGRGVLCACGCGQPAAQVDHNDEHQHGGRTAEHNLGGLTTRCHGEKSDAVEHGTGWTPRRQDDGIVVWTSPFGHERHIRPSDVGLVARRAVRVRSVDEVEPAIPARTYDPTQRMTGLNVPLAPYRGPDPMLEFEDLPPF